MLICVAVVLLMGCEKEIETTAEPVIVSVEEQKHVQEVSVHTDDNLVRTPIYTGQFSYLEGEDHLVESLYAYSHTLIVYVDDKVIENINELAPGQYEIIAKTYLDEKVSEENLVTVEILSRDES